MPRAALLALFDACLDRASDEKATREALNLARKKYRVCEGGRRRAEAKLGEAFAFRERLHANLMREKGNAGRQNVSSEKQWIEVMQTVRSRAELTHSPSMPSRLQPYI